MCRGELAAVLVESTRVSLSFRHYESNMDAQYTTETKTISKKWDVSRGSAQKNAKNVRSPEIIRSRQRIGFFRETN